MNEQEQLKLQAYLDGELTDRERGEVAALLDERADARELLAELQHTRAALHGNEPVRTLTCSREFYWHRLERELTAAEQEAGPAPAVTLLHWLRGHLRPILGTGVVVALLALTLTLFSTAPVAAESDWEVLHPETGMVSLRDYQNGITVVMLYDRSTPGFTSGD